MDQPPAIPLVTHARARAQTPPLLASRPRLASLWGNLACLATTIHFKRSVPSEMATSHLNKQSFTAKKNNQISKPGPLSAPSNLHTMAIEARPPRAGAAPSRSHMVISGACSARPLGYLHPLRTEPLPFPFLPTIIESHFPRVLTLMDGVDAFSAHPLEKIK
jgi:hypothetical protein